MGAYLATGVKRLEEVGKAWGGADFKVAAVMGYQVASDMQQPDALVESPCGRRVE